MIPPPATAATAAMAPVAMPDVKQVWAHNVHAEVPFMLESFRLSSFTAIDTEFPGFLHHTSLFASVGDLYEDVRRNVDSLKIIQLGFSCISNAGRRRTRQINFRDFDVSTDLQWEASVKLLERKGVDFKRTRGEGVDSAILSALLRPYFNGAWQRKPLWVTFHGLYDVAYVVKLITRAPLPKTPGDFARLVGQTLGGIIDVKHMAKFWGRSRFGLERLSLSFDVAAGVGSTARQAGIQSLLTGSVFQKMMEPPRVRGEEYFVGILYGFETERIFPPPIPPYPEYCFMQWPSAAYPAPRAFPPLPPAAFLPPAFPPPPRYRGFPDHRRPWF